MIEKVNPHHPDKIADRIAGAIVDLAYTKNDNPKVAAEVLLGHGTCTVILETSEDITEPEVAAIVHRIAGEQTLHYVYAKQDEHLAKNQADGIRCGDNGIFKGSPLSAEQRVLSTIARKIYEGYPTDGKYILDDNDLIVCQSNAERGELRRLCLRLFDCDELIVNPLGDWTGGTNVDAGATNRKLGSDMADGVTGGGLHGKDLSKADVSVNIWCFLKAQQLNRPYYACCAIGDTEINGVPYEQIVKEARQYINIMGGFEKFAEWGLF